MIKCALKKSYKNILGCGITGAIWLLSTSAAAPANALTPEIIAEIEKLVSQEMSTRSVPGISVAIAMNKKLIWSKGYGLADAENYVPVTENTLFRTASIDKWMTSTAAMRLVEEGKLSLKEEARTYCTNFPEKRWRVNVHHLLNHSAGVRHYWGDNDEPQETDAQKEKLKAQMAVEHADERIRYTNVQDPVLRFHNDPLLFKPGSRYQYTSHGYRLVGCVLAGAAKEKYTDLMQRLVFDPAGMTHTTQDDGHAIIPHRTQGYSLTEDGHLRRARFRDVSENLPAGGHLSTPSDIVRFVSKYIWGGLLTEKSIERAQRRPSYSGADDTYYYGFGVGVANHKESPYNGIRTLSHSGGQAGTHTMVVAVPEKGIVVSLFSNNDKSAISDVTWSIVSLLIK